MALLQSWSGLPTRIASVFWNATHGAQYRPSCAVLYRSVGYCSLLKNFSGTRLLYLPNCRCGGFQCVSGMNLVVRIFLMRDLENLLGNDKSRVPMSTNDVCDNALWRLDASRKWVMTNFSFIDIPCDDPLGEPDKSGEQVATNVSFVGLACDDTLCEPAASSERVISSFSFIGPGWDGSSVCREIRRISVTCVGFFFLILLTSHFKQHPEHCDLSGAREKIDLTADYYRVKHNTTLGHLYCWQDYQ